jgi:hypothetical protein
MDESSFQCMEKQYVAARALRAQAAALKNWAMGFRDTPKALLLYSAGNTAPEWAVQQITEAAHAAVVAEVDSQLQQLQAAFEAM